MTKSNAQRILIVDDEHDIIELLSYNLSKEGYNVTAAMDGEMALKQIKRKIFDLIILDLMLPGMQGMELCRILRNDPKTKNLPVIILTAKTEEVDRILGLELGADDYITKPFSPRELIARIKAVLRRSKRAKPEEKYITIGELTINTDTYSVSKKNVTLNLSPTEFKLLMYLVERRGKIYNREHLMNTIWKDEGDVDPRTVDVHISRIRAQIEDDPAKPIYIKTRRGRGYYIEDNSPESE